MNNRRILYRLILAVLLATVPLADQQADPLIAAYQKEFVYLDNEIRLLEKRLAEVQRDGESRLNGARLELDGLEAQLLSLHAEVERRSEDLRRAEQSEASVVDLSDVVGSVLDQAAALLERYHLQPSSAGGGRAEAAEELEGLLGQSLRLLGALGGLRREPGRFFLQNGNEVEGTLVHLGAVASFGISSTAGGTLAPAGGGRLRLVKPSGLPAAKELEAGGNPKMLPIFLYGSLDKLVEDQQKRGFVDRVRGGGAIGVIILGIGAASVLLVLVRVALLWSASRKDPARIGRIMASLERGVLPQARSECESLRGAFGRVLSATLRALGGNPDKVEDVIAESVLNEQPRIERYRSALNVFAAVAPLLGLLGTVTGMISTFEVITRYGTGDPKLLSGGISEALITTEFGLYVAIPVLLFGNLLASWSDRITSDLEVTALRAVNAATAAGSWKSNANYG